MVLDNVDDGAIIQSVDLHLADLHVRSVNGIVIRHSAVSLVLQITFSLTIMVSLLLDDCCGKLATTRFNRHGERALFFIQLGGIQAGLDDRFVLMNRRFNPVL